MLEEEIEYCFHLAAQSIVNVAQSSPRSTLLTNTIGTLNILEAARKSESIRGLVVASTDKVYGEPERLPITEEHPLEPRHIYESSKACADILSRAYFQSYGLPIGIARCTNIYGGRDMNRSRIIPSLIVSLLRNKSPIVESDGSPVRDYMYVSDAVAAYLAIARNISRPGVKGQPLNFGTGKPTSVRDVVSNLLRIFETKLQATYLNKPGGIKSQYVSAAKAHETLEWRPKVSLEEGLEWTIEWYKKYEAYLD
jgi:CDP-glucose 4,6-dehydratase